MTAAVCVALSVRDGERFLAEAIESVLAQEGVSLELRVYDNGSTDGSVELARAYEAADARVSVTRNDPDANYFDSLNRALAETACPYFAPFADDDLMYPGNLAHKVAALELHGAALAHSATAHVDETGAVTGRSSSFEDVPEYLPAPAFFSRLVPFNVVSCQSVVARTEALRWLGGFDPAAWYCGDWLAWLRLSLRLGVVTLREQLAANRFHPASGTSTARRTGSFAPHLLAALDRALADDWFPRQWAAERPLARGRLALELATDLRSVGRLDAAGGPAAYAYAAEALGIPGLETAAETLFADLVAAAGLAPPALPFDAVAPLPADRAAAEGLAAAARELAGRGLLGTLALADRTADLTAAASRLAPVLDEVGVDVDLVSADLADLLRPGRVALLPGGSDPGLAESRGVPVLRHGAALPGPGWLLPPEETLEEAA